jgi:hypothetical protein
MTDEALSETEEPVPTRTKVIAGLMGSALLLVAAYALLRISSPAIRPDQSAPAGHYTLSCALCHTLSSEAATIEVPR